MISKSDIYWATEEHQSSFYCSTRVSHNTDTHITKNNLNYDEDTLQEMKNILNITSKIFFNNNQTQTIYHLFVHKVFVPEDAQNSES